MTRKMSVYVQCRCNHLRPNYIAHVSNSVTFFSNIFDLRSVEYMDVELMVQRPNYIEWSFCFNFDYFIYFSRTRNKLRVVWVVLSLGERGREVTHLTRREIYFIEKDNVEVDFRESYSLTSKHMGFNLPSVIMKHNFNFLIKRKAVYCNSGLLNMGSIIKIMMQTNICTFKK